MSSFSGPLPPPRGLDDYDRICPGAADRIIKMAEAEQRSAHKTGLYGLVFGSITFMLTLALIGWALFLGQPLAAAIIFALVSVNGWILGRKAMLV